MASRAFAGSASKSDPGGDWEHATAGKSSKSFLPPIHLAGGSTNSPAECLAYFEGIMEECLSSEERMAEALFEIQLQRLYKQTHNSFGAYVDQRWKLSRARAYQLIHLAKRKKAARLKGEPAPANERQARQIAANGTRLPPEENSHTRRVALASRYIKTNLAKVLPEERRKYLVDFKAVLEELLKEMDAHPRAHSKERAQQVKEFSPSVLPANASFEVPPTASLPPSAPVGLPQTAEAANEVTGHSQPNSGSAAPAPLNKELQIKPQPGEGADPKKPLPVGNAGPVQAFTMEQARRLGIVPK